MGAGCVVPLHVLRTCNKEYQFGGLVWLGFGTVPLHQAEPKRSSSRTRTNGRYAGSQTRWFDQRRKETPVRTWSEQRHESGAALLLVEVHRGGSGVGWATGERGAAMGPLKHKGTRLGMVVVGCLQVRTPAPPAHTTAACIARARSAMSASGGLSGDTSVTPSFLPGVIY